MERLTQRLGQLSDLKQSLGKRKTLLFRIPFQTIQKHNFFVNPTQSKVINTVAEENK